MQFVLELNRKAEWEQLAQCELLKIVGTGLLNNYGESFKTYWDSNGWF